MVWAFLTCLYWGTIYANFLGKEETNRKDKFFRQNGGFLLPKRLSSHGRSEHAKTLTAQELQKATDNYKFTTRARFSAREDTALCTKECYLMAVSLL